MLPSVSVLMPVYNSQLYLKDAIESILNQSFGNFEFIIVNDGSTDDSSKIVASFSDTRIRYFSFDNNQGVVKALNFGLDKAQGKYIARMDSDDVADPRRLEKQFQYMEVNPKCVVCGSRFTFLGTNQVVNLPITDAEIKLKMLSATPICHPSVFVRRDTLTCHNLYYRSRTHCEDLDLWVRMSQFGQFYNLDESLLYYRIHGSNISLKKRNSEELSFLFETQIEYITFFFSASHLSREEIMAIYRLFYEAYFQLTFLIYCGKTIHKVFVHNQEYIVDSKLVRNYLIKQYFHGCTCSTSHGLNVFFLANQFGFFKIPIFLNLKLFVKAVIRYKA